MAFHQHAESFRKALSFQDRQDVLSLLPTPILDLSSVLRYHSVTDCPSSFTAHLDGRNQLQQTGIRQFLRARRIVIRQRKSVTIDHYFRHDGSTIIEPLGSDHRT